MIDNHFNHKKFLKEMAEYTFLLHLSNIRVTDKLENGHNPVLRKLNYIDGWCNIEEFLQIIASVNKNVKVLFEHRSDMLTDDELINCYAWVMDCFEN